MEECVNGHALRLGLPQVACIWAKFHPKSFTSLDKSADSWLGMTGPQGSYLLPGLYALQLRHWLRFFPRDQFYFTSSKAFQGNTKVEMRSLASFIGLSEADLESANELALSNRYRTATKGGGKEGTGTGGSRRGSDLLSPGLEFRLRVFFEPHNRDLWGLVGRVLVW